MAPPLFLRKPWTAYAEELWRRNALKWSARMTGPTTRVETRRVSENEEEDSVAALTTLPDDALLQILVACSEGHIPVPTLDAVNSVGCLCKEVLQQLYRLQPTVRVQVFSFAVTQPLTQGPWRVVVWITGELTASVVEQASHGSVRSISDQPIPSRLSLKRFAAAGVST